MKTCTKCKDEKNEEEFAFKNKTTRQRHSWCMSCHTRYNTQYYQQNKAKYRKKNIRNRGINNPTIASLVLSEKSCPCMDCAQTFPAVAMDFDHVRGVKKVCIATLMQNTVSFDAVIDELSKCEPVCACCHRIRTATKRSGMA